MNTFQRQVVVAMLVVGLLTSCSDADSSSGALPVGDASAALRFAQRALDKAGGYQLRVDQSNFVMPQWGGSDGGTVTVNSNGTAAEARLVRTGEPGATYAVTLVEGQTFFRRSTCSETLRVPGGGADVLQPYLFMRSQALAGAQGARFESGLIRATIEGLGLVTIELNNKTLRPEEIRGTASGRDLIWTFEDWDVSPDVSKPGGNVQERGPGGIRC